VSLLNGLTWGSDAAACAGDGFGLGPTFCVAAQCQRLRP